MQDLESRRKKESGEDKDDKDDDDDDDEADTAGSKGSELSVDEDVYEGEDEQQSKFCDVYSDTESEEEEEEEEYVKYLFSCAEVLTCISCSTQPRITFILLSL